MVGTTARLYIRSKFSQSFTEAERRSAMVAYRLYGLLFVLFSGLALGAPWPSAAQQATPPYGAPISLEQAKKIIAAAEAEAQKNNWPVVITVVDTGGHVVAVHRLDNTQLGSIAAAEDKAATAGLVRRPAKAFEGAVSGGGNRVAL